MNFGFFDADNGPLQHGCRDCEDDNLMDSCTEILQWKNAPSVVNIQYLGVVLNLQLCRFVIKYILQESVDSGKFFGVLVIRLCARVLETL